MDGSLVLVAGAVWLLSKSAIAAGEDDEGSGDVVTGLSLAAGGVTVAGGVAALAVGPEIGVAECFWSLK